MAQCLARLVVNLRSHHYIEDGVTVRGCGVRLPQISGAPIVQMGVHRPNVGVIFDNPTVMLD